MNRAARVAESAGALLGPWFAHAELQPVAAETPFRASVPSPQPRRARRRRPRAREGPLILLYHRVIDPEGDASGVCVSPANFARQLEVLKAWRDVVPLTEIAGDVPPSAAAVTLDDGYRATLEHAAPALAAGDIPATLFVATGPVAEAKGFWWDELERLLRTAPNDAEPSLTLELAGQRRTFRVGSEPERRIARLHLFAWLQPLAPREIGAALTAVRRWAGACAERGAAEVDRAMTPDELRAFAGTPGVTIGAHTRSHRSLRHADAAAQEAEITGSRDDVISWLGTKPTSFSYPFGVPGAHLDDAVVTRVRAAGFSLGVTTAPGVVSGADRFRLPRCVVPDIDDGEFGTWLQSKAVG